MTHIHEVKLRKEKPSPHPQSAGPSGWRRVSSKRGGTWNLHRTRTPTPTLELHSESENDGTWVDTDAEDGEGQKQGQEIEFALDEMSPARVPFFSPPPRRTRTDSGRSVDEFLATSDDGTTPLQILTLALEIS